ncbi:hypothetical protein PRIPAC_71985, partial [Pristionchus pacificus]|uniref:Uncharacterized protein n=1 Tax=Pristionchus pacificus TaxID=54126 RepID=A0A2A6C6R4_PRIPA
MYLHSTQSLVAQTDERVRRMERRGPHSVTPTSAKLFILCDDAKLYDENRRLADAKRRRGRSRYEVLISSFYALYRHSD